MESEVFKICGLGEGEVKERLKNIRGREGVSFALSENDLDCKIMMRTENLKPLEFAAVKTLVYNAFEDEVYAAMDVSLAALGAKLLNMNHRVLSVAESLTGGEICSKLCSISGISENFFEGIVCYNRASKMDRLGVSRNTLADYGAVSRQTAYEMVQGLLRGRGNESIGLATTGLAGPTGDEGKPVGLVYIGVGSGDFITVFEKHLTGDRNQIRGQVVNLALFYLVRYLKGDILRL